MILICVFFCFDMRVEYKIHEAILKFLIFIRSHALVRCGFWVESLIGERIYMQRITNPRIKRRRNLE